MVFLLFFFLMLVLKDTSLWTINDEISSDSSVLHVLPFSNLFNVISNTAIEGFYVIDYHRSDLVHLI